jgi:HD-GYP domain-containing protein (c-di-GMP phosphodiesterase class II)
VLGERSGSQFDPRVIEAFLKLHQTWKHRQSVPASEVPIANSQRMPPGMGM